MARIYSIVCFTVVAGIFVSTIATDYCKIQCRKFDGSLQQHTMCKYPSPNLGPKCNKAHDIGLSDTEKQMIVQKHNELRRKVASGKETRGNPGPQPAAVSMPDLTWDNELENIAQRWANQCTWGHDKCKNVQRFDVGQNIAYTTWPNESVIDMVQGWYDEVEHFDRNKVSRCCQSTGKPVGHYTQMVWANTRTIGCGRIKYEEDGAILHYLICNYGPAGNFIGQKMYEIKK